MGRKASGKERVGLIEKDQENRTVYVYRRVSVYNKERGYYVSKEQKLLGKNEWFGRECSYAGQSL